MYHIYHILMLKSMVLGEAAVFVETPVEVWLKIWHLAQNSPEIGHLFATGARCRGGSPCGQRVWLGARWATHPGTPVGRFQVVLRVYAQIDESSQVGQVSLRRSQNQTGTVAQPWPLCRLHPDISWLSSNRVDIHCLELAVFFSLQRTMTVDPVECRLPFFAFLCWSVCIKK